MDPLASKTLPEVLSAAAVRYGGAVAVRAPSYEGELEALTYIELERFALAIHAAYLGDIEAGNYVVLGGRNSVAWIAALFAIGMAGGVAVPIDHEAPPGFISAAISELRPALVLGDRAFLDRCPTGVPCLALEEVPRQQSLGAPPPVEPAGDSLALLLYTAGTTGKPKAVMLSHGNIVSNMRGVVDAAGLGPGDAVFVVLPLYHSFPLTVGCVSAVAAGVRIELEHRLLRIARRLREAQPTVILGVPALYESLLHQIQRRATVGGGRGRLVRGAVAVNRVSIRLLGVNLARVLLRPVQSALGGRLRYAVSGGAALSIDVAHLAAVYGIPLIQGYGLSEAAPVVAVPRFRRSRFWWTRRYWERAGSVGQPLAGVHVRLDPLPGGEPGEGELLVEGPNVMRGYLGDDEQTAVALRGAALRTGDLARIDGEGWIWITGRRKFAVSTPEGKLVHLEALDRAFAAVAEIEQVCVIAEEGPWRLVAIVFPSGQADAEGTSSASEIEQRVRDAMSMVARDQRPYERADEIRLTDEPLPVTRLGKVRRAALPSSPSFDHARWREQLAMLHSAAR